MTREFQRWRFMQQPKQRVCCSHPSLTAHWSRTHMYTIAVATGRAIFKTHQLRGRIRARIYTAARFSIAHCKYTTVSKYYQCRQGPGCPGLCMCVVCTNVGKFFVFSSVFCPPALSTSSIHQRRVSCPLSTQCMTTGSCFWPVPFQATSINRVSL